MAETFYNDWSLQVGEKNADYSQRFIISGSDNSDGIYLGTPGTTISRVSGQQWLVTMEWNDNAGSGWQPSRIQRSASYNAQDGLLVVLGADDSPPPNDADFDDLILICKSLDPKTDPLRSLRNPYDFTINKGSVREDDI